MPKLLANEPLDLTVNQRSTPISGLDGLRNLHTVQSALLRGDREVTLHNTPGISHDIRNRLRRNHMGHMHQSVQDDVAFRLVKRPKKDDRMDEHRLANMFGDYKWQGFKFEFLKILGTGGFGAGTLWNIHLEGGASKKVVLKVPMSMGSWDSQEMVWHQRYGGSRHTVQLVDLAETSKAVQDEFKLKNPGQPLQYDQGEVFRPDMLAGMVLEYMSYGDLFGILRKASSHIECFPDRVLWGIWECLVKGAAAVAYQPTFKEQNRVFEQEMEQAKAEGKLEAFFRKLEKEKIAHDIHLDLEESNILAGDASDHPNQPVFKIHDFGGFSHKMSEAWTRADEEFYWRLRNPCKMTRLTPEQVHQEWDQLSLNVPHHVGIGRFQGDNLTRGNPIAGRFGVWTNIFILAKTMEAVVTLMFLAHPFSAKNYVSIDRRTKGRTYGWRLNMDKYRHVDQELRDILCQCLFERPLDRPSIIGLMRNIERRKRQGFEQSEEDVKRFWTDFFAPQPAVPIPEMAHPNAEQDLTQAFHDEVLVSTAGVPPPLNENQPPIVQPQVEPRRPINPGMVGEYRQDAASHDLPLRQEPLLGDAPRGTSLPPPSQGRKRQHGSSQDSGAEGGYMFAIFSVPDGSDSMSSGDMSIRPSKKIKIKPKTDKRPANSIEIKANTSNPSPNLTKPVERVRFKGASKVQKQHKKTPNSWLNMPVAIQNLAIRTKQLGQRIGCDLTDQVSRPAWEHKGKSS
ncbi:hypothetical protein BKA56DRAFT_673931 [Ilyonectria sp. MPI-CAGE-AT-0026]|nr:hypothetical protein BKA56DRAFT_673931 [Ilyonectria sp. MPI-CAGE-AT-0026]